MDDLAKENLRRISHEKEKEERGRTLTPKEESKEESKEKGKEEGKEKKEGHTLSEKKRESMKEKEKESDEISINDVKGILPPLLSHFASTWHRYTLSICSVIRGDI